MTRELLFFILIFGLLVVPRVLQRWKLPAPLTCLVLGLLAMLAFGDRVHDPVLVLLSTLGISSLFLFAGLEVDPRELRRGAGPLIVHLLIRCATLAGAAWLAWRYLGLNWQAATLLALAVLTPSTGFILDTLERLGLDEAERFWVTSKAIAGELLALAALFVVLQAGDTSDMATNTGVLLAMLVGLPLLFIALGRWVVPHAPGSEFSLLVMVGMVAAYITYSIGVYYLVGAFIAGLVARLLRVRMPRLASDDNIHALRLFASFFVPFYFFHAGTGIPREALSWEAVLLGVVLTMVVLPLRIGVVWLQRRVMFREAQAGTLKVSVALAPTLVFTLVLAEILYRRFDLPPVMYGALLLYTAINTLLPSLLLKAPFDVDPADDSLPRDEAPARGAGGAVVVGAPPAAGELAHAATQEGVAGEDAGAFAGGEGALGEGSGEPADAPLRNPS